MLPFSTRPFVLSALILVGAPSISSAQMTVVNGLYDCQRATNNRVYCKRQGAPPDNQYQPVTEEFFSNYEAMRLGRSAPPPVIANTQNNAQVNNTQVNNSQVNNTVIIELKSEASDLKGQIELLSTVALEQNKLASRGGDAGVLHKETVEAIEERVRELRTALTKKVETLAKSYSTPIKPDDAELGVTARRASETYPKVPYYIPGTKEMGEFWIEPTVSDSGVLIFRFKFVDVKSTAAEKVRSTIDMKPEEMEITQKGLLKVGSNSRIAHEKKIRRKVDVRIDCFPKVDCPPEGQKIDGKPSTELIFSINEDGSTSGRIQRNKGRFEEGYNFSVKSGLLLQAYMNHVLTEGKAEFEAGSATQEDLKNMFR
jgi:hypothetical protein